MGMNRKNGSGSVRLGLVGLAVWVCGFLCLSGLGYTWHRHRNVQLSRQLHQRSAHLEWVRMQNQQLDRVLEELRSPRALQAALLKWHLDMVVPDRVLAVQDPGPDRTVAARQAMTLADGSGGR